MELRRGLRAVLLQKFQITLEISPFASKDINCRRKLRIKSKRCGEILNLEKNQDPLKMLTWESLAVSAYWVGSPAVILPFHRKPG